MGDVAKAGETKLDGNDIRADGKPYQISDYRAKSIMEDFARAVSRHGFSAGGRIESFIQSIINWKNDCAKFGQQEKQGLDEDKLYQIVLSQTPLEKIDCSLFQMQELEAKRMKKAKVLTSLIISQFSAPSQRVPSKIELMSAIQKGLDEYDKYEQMGRDVAKLHIAKAIHSLLERKP